MFVGLRRMLFLGEVSERFKVLVWKASGRNCLAGSNPALSADGKDRRSPLG